MRCGYGGAKLTKAALSQTSSMSGRTTSSGAALTDISGFAQFSLLFIERKLPGFLSCPALELFEVPLSVQLRCK